MRILVTGLAGFIGFHSTKLLLSEGHEVFGIDSLSPYYDVSLKEARLQMLSPNKNFRFEKLLVEDKNRVQKIFQDFRPERVLHLAAQAGVRHSLEAPFSYVDANISGFLSILEACRAYPVEHLVYASTSSVYGLNEKMPFTETQGTAHPVSLYSATKKANELMAHAYAQLFQIPCTGLRFFTVYGPWGRPDMALFKFTKAILAGEPIPVFNHGHHSRDFTYIDDIVKGTLSALLGSPAAPHPDWDPRDPRPDLSSAPYRIFNIGNTTQVKLSRMIEILEDCLGKKAKIEYLPKQAGDVEATWASVEALHQAVGYEASTPIEVGVANFVRWYRDYYQV